LAVTWAEDYNVYSPTAEFLILYIVLASD